MFAGCTVDEIIYIQHKEHSDYNQWYDGQSVRFSGCMHLCECVAIEVEKSLSTILLLAFKLYIQMLYTFYYTRKFYYVYIL